MTEVFSPSISATLQGLVEGLTEFLPVSSTGHLILVGDLIQFTGDKAETFDIFIQLGAILAVVVLYFNRFLGLLDFRSRTSFRGWDGLWKLAVACLPAFVLGALLHGLIKRLLFAPLPVACALIVGGVIMLIVERRHSNPSVEEVEEISYTKAFGIGLFQCLALWPGMSRSASTIIGGMILGTSRRAAAEFSFLVAVPVMVAATSFDMLKSYRLLSHEDIPVFAIGFVVSFLTAIAAIKFFMALLNRWTLVPFGVYRILLGTLAIALTVTGVLGR